MSDDPNATMVDRIQRTLKRLGFNDCVLRDIDNGTVTLFCQEADRNDHSMIQVAIRLIPGINSVVFSDQSQHKEKS